jgi:hypothetical protein
MITVRCFCWKAQLVCGDGDDSSIGLGSHVRGDFVGCALVLGFFTRVAALLSGLMLLVFALTMTFALGVKAPLDFSVFSASAAAFVLAACGKYPLSIDALRSPHES